MDGLETDGNNFVIFRIRELGWERMARLRHKQANNNIMHGYQIITCTKLTLTILILTLLNMVKLECGFTWVLTLLFPP